VLVRELPGVLLYPVRGKKRLRWEAAQPAYEADQVWFPEAKHMPDMLDFIDRMLILTGEGEEIDDEADAD
jgi:hypothetical protein